MNFATAEGHLAALTQLVKEHKADASLADKVLACSTRVCPFTPSVQNGWTALMIATEKGHLDCLSFLVREANVDVNARGSVRDCAVPSALLDACCQSVSVRAHDCVRTGSSRGSSGNTRYCSGMF